MRVRWQELIVPALALAFVASFWIQLEGAMRPARLVPDGVMLLTVLLAAVVALRDGVLAARADVHVRPDDAAVDPGRPGWLDWWREISFIVLCVGYYLAFYWLGFHVANALFLLATLRIMGNRWRTVLLATFCTCLAIYTAAELMQFNMVTPRLFS